MALNTTEDKELINQIGSLAVVPRAGKVCNEKQLGHATPIQEHHKKAKPSEDPN